LTSPTLKPPARTGDGWKSSTGLPGVPLSSLTTTFLIGSLLPVAVTLYVQVIGVPTGTSRPGALSLLVPLVSFTIWIWGLGTNAGAAMNAKPLELISMESPVVPAGTFQTNLRSTEKLPSGAVLMVDEPVDVPVNVELFIGGVRSNAR